MPTENDKRIARNTVYLYGRMMLTIFVSLYTSRVILDVLGVSDFGVYNVVGGIVTILGFLNGTMSGATSRFLSYELGAGDSFTAAFIASVLKEMPVAEAHRKAVATSAFVCTHKGAMPILPKELTE